VKCGALRLRPASGCGLPCNEVKSGTRMLPSHHPCEVRRGGNLPDWAQASDQPDWAAALGQAYSAQYPSRVRAGAIIACRKGDSRRCAQRGAPFKQVRDFISAHRVKIVRHAALALHKAHMLWNG
jgi:hypothetical protein